MKLTPEQLETITAKADNGEFVGAPVLALLDHIRAVEAERDAEHAARIAAENQLIEWHEWARCQTCGVCLPQDDFIEDADGRLGVWDDGPIHCPACAAKIGWFCRCDGENFQTNDLAQCPDCLMWQPGFGEDTLVAREGGSNVTD